MTACGSQEIELANNIAARKHLAARKLLGRGEAQIAEACGEVLVWMKPSAL